MPYSHGPYADWPEEAKERKRAEVRRYQERNKEKVREARKEYHQKRWTGLTKEERRDHNLAKFGLTHKEWVALFESQGRRCAMPDCRSESPRSKMGWHTDHDHVSQKVRGILCAKCNQSLGFYEKSKKRAGLFELYMMGTDASKLC